MKTYYHISMEHEKEIEKFIPRIPKNRASKEDRIQQRICVSTTLQGCVKAAPTIWYNIHDYLTMDYYDPYLHMERLTTLLEHDEKVGYLFKVYEFDLEENEVISADVLKKNEWVPDAHKTGEHWITKPTKPTRSYYILLENTREENGEPLFDSTKYELCELGSIETYLDTFDSQKKKENAER